MPLQYDLIKIPNYTSLCFDESGRIKQNTETLIFSTMLVDIGEITADNIDEWLFRLAFYAQVTNNAGLAQDLNEEFIIAHAGLRTNVGNKSRAKYITRITKLVCDEITKELQHARDRRLGADSTL